MLGLTLRRNTDAGSFTAAAAFAGRRAGAGRFGITDARPAVEGDVPETRGACVRSSTGERWATTVVLSQMAIATAVRVLMVSSLTIEE
jgi:hypothetical protein